MKYLTKSRFKIALECPGKLYYTSKKNEYIDRNVEDTFIQSLAEGGFQVAELAKLYYPGGIAVTELDYERSIIETERLLSQENVIIYEAAFRYNSLFVRTDIIVKQGLSLQLIEVKAKSISPSNDDFFGKKGGIKSEWRPYLNDVAFQRYVVEKSHPEFKVSAFLMLADKDTVATVDGLNQKFLVHKNLNGRTVVKLMGDVSLEKLGNRILTAVPVDDAVDVIVNSKGPYDDSFSEMIDDMSSHYREDKKMRCDLGVHCGNCEFNASREQIAQGYKSGFRECWIAQANFKDEDFDRPSILKLWNFRKKNEFIRAGKYFLSDISREDLEGNSKAKKPDIGLSAADRQHLQIEKATNNDSNHFIDIDGLKGEMTKWRYPLHFIDFETTAVAIPFNAGRRPYEQVAFQFSHHVVREDGTVEHAGQWINSERGEFPNFEFVRALKKQLETDDGTIFRYAAHENTILNAIYKQLKSSSEVDKEILCPWIKTITRSKSDSVEKWEGARNMVDLRDVVLRYYYHPLTGGSNSLKYVLPSIIQASDYLKDRYSKPIYGNQIKSLNFENHTWITFDGSGLAVNPYNVLPSVFEGYPNEILDEFMLDEDAGVFDGGAAMIAYAKMQFCEMSSEERGHITRALLKYCELDTLAMVMIWEAWNEWCK